MPIWTGTGCYCGFGNHKHCDLSARNKFLKKYSDGDCKPSQFPFVHCIMPHPLGFGFDPLVIPIVNRLNTMEGVKTLFSCQGQNTHCPYIAFTATPQGIESVYDLVDHWDKESRFFNNGVITYEGLRDDEPEYLISFFDTIALIQFNRDILKVSLIDQFTPMREIFCDPDAMDFAALAETAKSIAQEIEPIMEMDD